MIRRRRDGRWLLLSAGLHALAFLLVPDRVVDLFGPDSTPAPGSRPGVSSAPRFSSFAPIEVVRLPDPVVDPAGPVSEVAAPPVRRPPVDVAAALRRVADSYRVRGSDGPPALAPTTPGGGADAYRAPVLVSLRWPDYPAEIDRPSTPITVGVRVRVLADGSVGDAIIETPTAAGALNDAALRSARRARFEPAFRDGRAVAAWYSLPITFNP